MSVGWVKGLAGVAVLVVVTACGSGAHVDATTSTAAPPVQASVAPTGLTRPVWSASHAAGLPVLVDGGYAIIAARHGVSVRDASDGRERWHYLDPRHALVRDEAGRQVDIGGGHLVVRYGTEGGQLIRVFDLAGGKLLRSLSTNNSQDTAVVDADDVYVVPGNEPRGTGLEPVRAVGLGDGRSRWSFTPRCVDGNPGTGIRARLVRNGGASSKLIILEGCTADSRSEQTSVTALSAATGHVAWHVDAHGDLPGTSPDGQTTAAPIVLADPGGQVTTIDAATGRAVTTDVGHTIEISAAESVIAESGGWFTPGSGGSVYCFDADGRARWHRPTSREETGDRHTIGIAATHGMLSLVTYTSTGPPAPENGWKEHFTATAELRRMKNGGRIGKAHQLPGATTTASSSWPGQFTLHAYDSSGLYLSTLTDTRTTAKLTVYR